MLSVGNDGDAVCASNKMIHEIKTIINQSNKEILTNQYCICNTLFSQARGLMFSSRKNLIFGYEQEKRVSLHMLFVFFPIWVLYLNKNKEVCCKKKLLPFISFFYPKQKAKYILELIEEPNVKINDSVWW